MTTLRRTVDAVGTELFSPFVLAGAMTIFVPLLSGPGWWWQALIGVMGVVGIPLALSLHMARTGQVSDRFLVHREQRHRFYALSLCSILAATVILLLTPAPATAKGLLVVMVVAIVLLALTNLRLKASAHAGMSGIFGVLLPLFLGWPLLFVSLLVHGVVCFSRWDMRKHSVAELAAGSVIGVALGLGYAVALF